MTQYRAGVRTWLNMMTEQSGETANLCKVQTIPTGFSLYSSIAII